MAVQFTKNITDKWKSYFPVRNGIKPETFLKEGRNYTNETLNYMSKARIARTITDKVESYLNDSKYLLVDMTAGIGGNVIEFLSRKNCSTVMAFEREPMRRLMLQRNIQGYKLDDKAIVVNGDKYKDVIGITGEEDFSAYNNAVFFFDPPWLPPDYKYAVKDEYKNYYIKKGAKVGNLSLEDWLVKLEDNAYMVVLRMPPEYFLESVPGWSYIVDDLGNDGRLIICFPNKYVKGAPENEPGEVINTSSESFKGMASFMMKLKPIKTELANQYETFRSSCNALSFEKAQKEDKCKIFVKWGFADPYPEVVADKPLPKLAANLAVQIKKDEYETKEERKPAKKLSSIEKIGGVIFIDDDEDVPLEDQVIKLKGIPRISNKNMDKESAEWQAEFQSYIHWILSQFLKGPKLESIVNELVSIKCMPKWVQAFTEESFLPDMRFNYDTLEFIGDRATEYVFSKILMDRIISHQIEEERKTDIELNAQTLTQLKKEYMSQTWQILTGKALGFSDWIRINGPLDDKKFEDILESFIGALVENGDNIKSLGMGIKLCHKFIEFITADIKFKKSLRYGDPYSQLRQRFERMFGDLIKKDKNMEVNQLSPQPNVIVQIKISKIVVEKLTQKGFIVPANGVLGTGKGSNLKISQLEASKNANKFLDGIGLTNEFTEKYKKERKWELLETLNAKLIKMVKTKLIRDNYTEEELNVDSRDIKGGIQIATLVVMNSQGQYITIGEGVDKDRNQAQLKALQDYLDK
jgi:dsRNA-specific ribonuclease/16S rRNA G966 N2-methylase RsmD